MRFKSFLNEKLITLGNKRPKYNQVVILAGGAGSGKGFVIDNLLGIEGKRFDVDKLKEQMLKSVGFQQKVKKQYGINLFDLDLKNSKDVSTLHGIVSDLKIGKKDQQNFFSAIGDTKPNIIFDVTLKDLAKLEDISNTVINLGYKKEDIHIVWVVNDLDTALQQNMERERRVNPDILKNTHLLVSTTMSSILQTSLRKYMDGDFWVVFNKKFSDSVIAFGDNGGSYIKDAIYFKIKKVGKQQMKISDISDEYINKIKKYVPNPEVRN